MTVQDLPLIMVGKLDRPAALTWAALADVIITATDQRCTRELFTNYPGLTLILVVHDGSAVSLACRDGQLLRLRTGRRVSIHAPWLRALALQVYAERIRRAA